MKTVIFYFTGTGNTLAIARNLATELGDAELIPIARTVQLEMVATDAGCVGIAFPVYFLDMPGMVREFVQKIRFTGTPYIFGIATCGMRPGSALFGLKSLLEEKGAALAAGFTLVMPENYIGPIDLTGDADRRQEKYSHAASRIPGIAAAIQERRRSVPEGTDSAVLQFGYRLARTLMTSVYNTPRRLHATGKCNRCRTCERICPTRNITVEKDTVRWGNSCTQCYACIHWCPNGAIEIGGRTAGKPRYHHPDVTLADMLDQRGGP